MEKEINIGKNDNMFDEDLFGEEEIKQQNIEQLDDLSDNNKNNINLNIKISSNVSENRKNMYKIVKYTKENVNEKFIKVEEIKNQSKYEGNPSNDKIVLLGYIREKSNINNQEYKQLETKFDIDPSNISTLLDLYYNQLIQFILKEEDKINTNADINLSDLLVTKNKESINKEEINKYFKENNFIETALVYFESEAENIHIINKNKIINYWGENYSLYFSYEKFEKLLIENNILKYTSEYIYIKNEKIKNQLKTIENLTNNDIDKIINVLTSNVNKIDIYKYKNEEYYEIIKFN